MKIKQRHLRPRDFATIYRVFQKQIRDKNTTKIKKKIDIHAFNLNFHLAYHIIREVIFGKL